MTRRETTLENYDFESVLDKLLSLMQPRTPNVTIRLILEQQSILGEQRRDDVTFPPMVPTAQTEKTKGPWVLFVKDFQEDIGLMVFRCDPAEEGNKVSFTGESHEAFEEDFLKIWDKFTGEPAGSAAQDQNVKQEPWRSSRYEKRERDKVIWELREENASWNTIADEIDRKGLGSGVNTVKENYRRMKALAERAKTR